jgi:hypothetical protein
MKQTRRTPERKRLAGRRDEARPPRAGAWIGISGNDDKGWVWAALDAYVYFDNDAKVHAPHDARRLLERVGRACHGEATSGSGPRE